MEKENLKNYKHKIPWAGGEYEGQLKYGVPEGFGKLVMPNRAAYEGEWLKGKPNGRGTIYYSGGGIYRGAVKNGKRQGKG
ncbi:MAG: 2-isopropylmalate synthase, partial [Dethiobacteria bacterium]